MSTDHDHQDCNQHVHTHDAPALNDISRQFLNSYFHLLCKEPPEAEIHAFYAEQKIQLISQYSKCSSEEMHSEASHLNRHMLQKQKELKPLRRHIIYALLIGVGVVALMLYTRFHWSTFVALIIAYILARNSRREYTFMEYQLIALQGLAHIFKEKFAIVESDET